MKISPNLISDSYKQGHYEMYPPGLTKLYSNFTARKSRILGVDGVVFFGLSYFIKEYLFTRFQTRFFFRSWAEIKREHIDTVFPFSAGKVSIEQWKALYHLGYLPLKIKAVPEGTIVPIGVPMLTVTNTHPDFAWLVNFIETELSTIIWLPITSATTALRYRKILTHWANETGGDLNFIDFQGHDFSMRGMGGLEAACLSGAGHLTSFKGTDTIPAVLFLENYYDTSNVDIIGCSVPATEHSVMSAGGRENEIDTFARLLDTFPEEILSVVSDTWNLWDVLTVYLPKLKDKILARNGKLVIRPDSGDPVDIICGDAWRVQGFTEGVLNKVGENGVVLNYTDNKYYKVKLNSNYEVIGEETTNVTPANKGVIELLWDVFGGTINEKGYKVLDPHIGAIYGDSITTERAEEICRRLAAKGFAATNIVLGIGSYTYQYVTRDTFGMAMKATYCEREEPFYASPESLEPGVRTIKQNIFKDPITDSGEKKSAKGLLAVIKNPKTGILELHQEVSEEVEETGELELAFNGETGYIRFEKLSDIRNRIKNQI